jgi:predicted CoA-binding protein
MCIKDKLIAVVGVSDNKEKFGYKIFEDLLKAGFKVMAVGVKGGKALKKAIHKSLKDLPTKPDIVVTVVPPIATDKIVNDVISLGIKEIWMQPGSVSDEAVKKARSVGIKVTDKGCFMVARGIW